MLNRDTPTPSAGSLTRRRLLVRSAGLAAGGAALAGVLGAAQSAQANYKVSQSQAGYKSSPRGGVRCDKCQQFQPPSGCKIVDGAISPSGSCNFFAPM